LRRRRDSPGVAPSIAAAIACHANRGRPRTGMASWSFYGGGRRNFAPAGCRRWFWPTPWRPRLKTPVTGFSFVRPMRERGFSVRGISRPLSPSCFRAKDPRNFSRAQDPTAPAFLSYISSQGRPRGAARFAADRNAKTVTRA
jgi:hypothetical protein